MNTIITPLQLLITAAGWLNRQQAEVISYLIEQNKVLLELAGDKQPKLTNDQRRRLAVKAKAIGRKGLFELPTIFQPDTLLGWHRKLVAKKNDYSKRRQGPGRPNTKKQITELILRFAEENSDWGYSRIVGALDNLGHTVARTTIAKILAKHSIVPAPERSQKTKWRDFLRAHWEVLAATDFFSIEVWTPTGLKTCYVLFFIKLSTRTIEITGISTNPNESFMTQMAKELTGWDDGFLDDIQYLIHDRDTKYTQHFIRMLKDCGVENIKLPRRSPNLDAYAERFVKSIKYECLNKLILFGEDSLRRAINEYVAHYHLERNHQGLGNKLIAGDRTIGNGDIECTERLGGMLKHYRRAA